MKHQSCGIVPFFKESNQIKFLLIEHLDGHWGFPKGKKEKNEKEIETAKREFVEEVGITDFTVLSKKTFIEKYSFKKNNVLINKEVIYFISEVHNNKVKIQEEEISKYAWLNYEDSIKILENKESAKILIDVFDYLKNGNVIF
jgi:8-oxo-dGTP pyrophosphatase MutT (NUDIX family)